MTGSLRRMRLTRWAAVCFGLACVVSTAELLARRVSVLQPVERQLRLHVKATRHEFQVDPDVGAVLVPNQSTLVETQDFAHLRETDARGFVNRGEWPRAPGLLLLGDSLTIGDGVGIDGSYATRLGAMLGVSVLNLGLPGAGPERQLRVLQKFGSELTPKAVISCVYLASDVRNDELFRSWLEAAREENFPEFRRAYWARLDTRPRYHPVRQLERWVLYQAVHAELGLWLGRHPPNRRSASDRSEVLLDARKTRFLSQGFGAGDPSVEALVNSLLSIERIAEGVGAQFVVALIPSKEELYLDDHPRIDELHRVFRQALERESLPTVDLYPVLAQGSESAAPVFARDLHLNDRGNALVAVELAKWARRALKLAGPR